jgi:hypothetical protein
MTEQSQSVQVKSLEAQLTVLKAQIKHLGAQTGGKTFADLYGVLAGKVDSSEEEIEGAQYRFEGEGMEQR